MSDKKLKGRIEELENTLREIQKYCNHLHNDCKYNLNDGHIRKIRNICKRELNKVKDNREIIVDEKFKQLSIFDEEVTNANT